MPRPRNPWRCWVCKLRGCALEVVTGARLVEAVHEPWNYSGDPDAWRVVAGLVRACTRCGHYEHSLVCGGRLHGD